MAIKIEQDRVVQLAYRIVDIEGHLLEEKTPENSYEYLHGRGQIVPPVERALEGKTAGFRAEVTVLPRDGFGEYDPSLVAELKRAHFPNGSQIDIGMKFNTLNPSGQTITVRVIEIDGDGISVDGNHPLAGLEVIFDLRVLDVREASEKEIETGRVEAAPPAAAVEATGASRRSIH